MYTSTHARSVSRPRPSQLGSSNSSSVFPPVSPGCPVTGPALRLIPATPVDPSMNSNTLNRLDSLEKPSTGSSTAYSDLTVELEVSNSSKTSPSLSRPTSLLDKNIDTTMSRSSSAKSRTSSISAKAASDLQKSGKASQTKSSRKASIKSSALGSFRKQPIKSNKKIEEHVSPAPSLVRSNTEKHTKLTKKPSTLQKSIRLVKKKSLRKGESSVDDACSVASPGKVQKKNSFYKVMDKLRGISRRSSMVSGESGGQTEFLDSISKMSDSRIVENWLLSLDDDQQNPEPVDGPSSLDPPSLEMESDSLMLPKSRTEDMVTPTNEHFELDTKAGASEKHKIVFDISSDDLSNVDESEDKFTRRCSRLSGRNFGRQVSESSEYTTDTHDTGETAQVTAINTLRNTSYIFTSEGDEMRKTNLSPPSPSSAIFKPIMPPDTDCTETEDLEVEAINSDRTDSHQTSKSNETVKTMSSTAHIPCYHIPSEAEGSDVQGTANISTESSDTPRQSQSNPIPALSESGGQCLLFIFLLLSSRHKLITNTSRDSFRFD